MIQAAQIGLEEFQKLLPIFQYVGRPVLISTRNDYVVDAEVQLVCKYLKAYDNEMEGSSSCKFTQLLIIKECGVHMLDMLREEVA